MFGPATTGLVAELVSKFCELQVANRRRGLVNSLATFARPALVGIVVVINPDWVIAVDAITSMASAALLGSLRLLDRSSTLSASFAAYLREG
jgi:hypothetical protein